MTADPDDWPDPLAGEYELRVTRSAREDLRVSGHASADLRGMQQASPWGEIVGKFATLRSKNPAGTEAPLSQVHRGDLYKLDGRSGARAVTWHDVEHGVVWLLAFTPQHDYELFVRRAATANNRGLGGANQLMPAGEDYEELGDDRGADWVIDRVLTGLQKLVEEARQTPGAVRRGLLADAVRAEVLVVLAGARPRLHLRFGVPPVRAGVLPSGFEWVFAAALDGVDSATLAPEPFPGGPRPGTVHISGELA